MAPTVLATRALNRALLARQLLLRRAELPVLDAVEHLVGLQAQSPPDPYYALAARLDGFAPDQLSGLLEAREAVRIPVMRSTIHLVSARDALVLRPLTQPVLDRSFRGNHGKRLPGVDLTDLAARARTLVAERPYTFHELGHVLAEHWPDHAPQDLAMAARTLLPLVQVTPRGLWGRSGPVAHTTTEVWLGRDPDPAPGLDTLLLRYLAAFGPASVKDIQTWSGLTRLREPADRLRPRLRVFRDEQGVELLDHPDAPLPDPETPAPVRFLPEFDNIALSHADRARIATPENLRRVWRVNRAHRAFLLDGFIAGIWRVERAGGVATMTVEPFAPMRRGDRPALEEEAGNVLALAAPGEGHEVRISEG
ncbi:winged helix DNA-binding domain-containing protein [Streptomyces sp. NPDC049577]|uniref:winged helix DNA-binding domain-containing protein n=1 Tax=Streptomyces sp. NPDC049577 TaxID=3155153 RepID=UPI003439226D